MEQDTAKTIMKDNMCLIDYNRAGMPLLEIVTRAVWCSDPEDCKLLVREMQEMLSALDISEAKAELGQLRCDVNISVWHPDNNQIRSPRVEIKNVAGAKNVERCVEYELRRHALLLESG
jgi:aspartyl-tRNA(Asn)/glutamyl-tRNA(Gln) amidotransferase subunit B